ncbi:hypothetical protein D9M68_620190 [compost metagenome]
MVAVLHGGTLVVAAEQDELRERLVVREGGMDLQLAEAARQRDMLRRRNVLLAEHQHLVLHQCAAQRGNGPFIKRRRQVDMADLGPERGRDAADRERRLQDRGAHDGGGGFWGFCSVDRTHGLSPIYNRHYIFG